MADNSYESDSRKLLGRLKAALAADSAGQERLDRVTTLIAESLGVEVCSIYLFRDADTLELCATEGLNPEAVHKTRMRIGEGLVGRVARDQAPDQHRRRPVRSRASATCPRPARRSISSLPRRADPAARRNPRRAGRAVEGGARLSPTTRSTAWKSSPWCWPR